MTTKFLKGIFVSLFVSVLLVSCEKSTNLASQTEKTILPPKTMTVLGDKLPNPYSPEDFKIAWENLTKVSPELTNGIRMDFKATHVYVKFTPKNIDELKQLQKAYGLNLSDIPSFFEYKIMGDYYHDPMIPEGKPTYQYATLPADAKLPNNIEHQVLEQMILLDPLEKFNNTLKYNEELYNELHHELYSISRLTNYAYEKGGSRGVLSKWRPSGKLTYFSSGTPYPYVYVRLHDFLFIPMINTGMTSGQDGKYNLGRDIRVKVFYRVHWGINEFSVSNFINRAYNAHRF